MFFYSLNKPVGDALIYCENPFTPRSSLFTRCYAFGFLRHRPGAVYVELAGNL